MTVDRPRVLRGSLVLLLLSFALGAFLYSPAWSMAYYADDFQWYWDPPPPSLTYFFSHANPYQLNAYRPIQAAFLILIQRAYGLSTWPIHVVVFGGHLLLAALVYFWMKRTGFPPPERLLASALLLVSQAAVYAVASNDTLSQVYSTLVGAAGLVLLERSRQIFRNPPSSRFAWVGPYSGSLVGFTVALLMKETGVSFAPMSALVLAATRRDLTRRRPTETALLMLPFVGIVLAYFWIRRELHLIGLEDSTSDRYRLDIGPKVFLNLGLFAFQSFLPTDSPRVFLALSRHDLLAAAGPVCATVALGMIVVRRSLLSSRRSLLLVLSGLGLVGLFPVALLAKVSELYLYNSLPFVAILTGHALGGLCTARARPRLTWVLTIAVLSSHFAGSRAKVGMMVHCGQEAQRLLTEITPFLPAVPSEGALLLVNPPTSGPNYSVFMMSGFRPLLNGQSRLQQIARRSDFRTYQVEGFDCTLPKNRKPLALTLDSRSHVVRSVQLPACP